VKRIFNKLKLVGLSLAVASGAVLGSAAIASATRGHSNNYEHPPIVCTTDNAPASVTVLNSYKKKKCQPPVDVCPNIEGNQTTVPEGLVKDNEGNCVEQPPVVDVCVNLEGNQTTAPAGTHINDKGACVEDEVPATPAAVITPVAQPEQTFQGK
jgi:hypothetical protein